MSEWRESKLGDIADIQNGYAFKSAEFAEEGMPIIKIKNIVPPIVVLDDVQFFDGEISEKLKRFLVKKNDFLISMTGSTVNQMASAVGKMSRYQHEHPSLINQRVAKIYSTSELVTDDYLFYYLNRYEVQYDLALSASGSANQANISPEQLKSYKILFPDLPTQKSITEILSSLDDKIELNNKINQELETLAQTLFKQWFIDFEFPNEKGDPYKSSGGEMVDSELGEIPKGWEVTVLSNLLTIKYGKDHKHLSDGEFPLYGSGGIMRFVEKPLYQKDSILIPRKGTLSNLFYLDEPFWSVDTMFYSEIHATEFRKFLFYWIKSVDIASMNVGSAVPSMTTKVLNEIKTLVPCKTLLNEFEECVTSFLYSMTQNRRETQYLIEIRDLLLPKLISGELEINEISN